VAFIISKDRLRFVLNRFREHLWVKPLVVCLLSITSIFLAKLADDTSLATLVPQIDPNTIEILLSIMASSMLVIATFSVGSMVSAFASASRTATPRSLTLVVADGESQNALSTFVGAFIFSIVALTAVLNGYFKPAGLFILFGLTVCVFAVVVLTFLGWVDQIARLGRMGSTIDKVEKAAAGALKRRKKALTLGGVLLDSAAKGHAVFASSVGYVQQIDVSALNAWAEKSAARVEVAALPGTFAAPDRALAYVRIDRDEHEDTDYHPVVKAFQIGGERLFDDDPRFGLVVLSEIAGRALSPAVNDPGTAIDIIGTLQRLFTQWSKVEEKAEGKAEGKGDDQPEFDRVAVPQISICDMFDDAFTAIARDGAGVVEVASRLQKALRSLASIGDEEMQQAAKHHSKLALERARIALDLKEDLAVVQDAALVP